VLVQATILSSQSQIQSKGSSATIVNKNVIIFDTPYINAKLQLSKKVSKSPYYGEMHATEMHATIYFDYGLD